MTTATATTVIRKKEEKMRSKINALFILFILGVLIAGFVPVGTAQSSESYAIRNARIVTVTGAVIEKGTVVIRDGKISAVGATVAVPSGAKIIDATGLSV